MLISSGTARRLLGEQPRRVSFYFVVQRKEKKMNCIAVSQIAGITDVLKT
jgi:hypothetical protein